VIFKKYGHKKSRFDEIMKCNKIKCIEIGKFDNTITGIIEYNGKIIVSTTKELYMLEEKK